MKIRHCLIFAILCLAPPALAQVRYGSNVRIGGHRIKPHEARWVKIRTITGYSGPYGCRTFANGATIDGKWYDGPIRQCVWKSVPPARR